MRPWQVFDANREAMKAPETALAVVKKAVPYYRGRDWPRDYARIWEAAQALYFILDNPDGPDGSPESDRFVELVEDYLEKTTLGLVPVAAQIDMGVPTHWELSLDGSDRVGVMWQSIFLDVIDHPGVIVDCATPHCGNRVRLARNRRTDAPPQCNGCRVKKWRSANLDKAKEQTKKAVKKYRSKRKEQREGNADE